MFTSELFLEDASIGLKESFSQTSAREEHA